MPTADEIKANQKSAWGGAAEGWERWDAQNVVATAPLTEWMCRAIEAAPGKQVLDIACGSGLPAHEVASRVRPGGKVIATDIAPAMLAVAERKARALGLDNIEFGEMDAENLRFPDASFDAVTFSFALMFCPDPVRALSQIRRVLKPGGRFALAVWDEPAKNPFFTTLFASVGQFFQAPPPDPKAPGPFRFAPPGELEGVIRAAGFADYKIESVPLTFEFASAHEYLAMCTDMAAGLKGRLATLSESDRARLGQVVAENTAPFADDRGRLRLTATPLAATGN